MDGSWPSEAVLVKDVYESIRYIIVIHQVVVMSAADARPLGELTFKQLLPIS